MEITYDSGAKVILEGPCRYEVESASGGYLSLGKLTARIEKRGEEQHIPLSTQQPVIRNPSPLAPLLSPLFAVRTPTAVVTDLGTEFGVEVDKSGASRAHVFRGRIEVRAVGNASPQAVSLGENESARIDSGKNRIVSVVHQTGHQHAFVREMPKSAPIQFFNTGKGLKTGDPDPHWQIVSRSDDPHFKPRPAVVVNPVPANGADNPSRSQWIAPAADFWLPDDVVYTFRATFDLTGLLPSRAALRGRFIADDMVIAIRLNGRRLKVPLQHEGEPYVHWTNFSANAGFVKGTNVLEIDVLNANLRISPSERHAMKTRSPTYCIVELEGEGVCDPLLVPPQEGKTAADPQTPKQTAPGAKEDSSEDTR